MDSVEDLYGLDVVPMCIHGNQTWEVYVCYISEDGVMKVKIDDQMNCLEFDDEGAYFRHIYIPIEMI